ncbi:MAG: hypothetical protein HY548_04095 [Elusimicrobia bacterium]|nr:hypothetical protein [Elusimicrobiota bacterium]
MTLGELLKLHNNIIRSWIVMAARYKHEAIELVGSPPIKYSKLTGQWESCGDVLRCVITYADLNARDLAFEIDGKELSLREFGAMLLSHEGWGMRIVFVPEDELHIRQVGTTPSGVGLASYQAAPPRKATIVPHTETVYCAAPYFPSPLADLGCEG